jgi:tRNA threonylcarbamoyladenosine biosynthesis protein TsaE
MIIENIDQMKEFAYKLAPLLKEGDVVNLEGDLGAGKTSLVSFIANYFSIKNATSPSFAIVNIYEGDIKIYHLDLYRFEDEDEILDIDFETYFYPTDAITFIEWSEKAKSYLPDGMINIKIEKLDENKREISLGMTSEKGERALYENLGN